jgi:hypothetical protein
MPGGKGKITGADGVPFKKNDPRINKKGRPLKLPDLDSLLIDVLGEDIKGKEALKVILIALRKKASAGDVRACELLLDRAYGKLITKKDIDLNFEHLSENDLDKIIEKLSTKN